MGLNNLAEELAESGFKPKTSWHLGSPSDLPRGEKSLRIPLRVAKLHPFDSSFYVTTWLGHGLPRCCLNLVSGCVCEGVPAEISI